MTKHENIFLHTLAVTSDTGHDVTYFLWRRILNYASNIGYYVNFVMLIISNDDYKSILHSI